MTDGPYRLGGYKLRSCLGIPINNLRFLSEFTCIRVSHRPQPSGATGGPTMYMVCSEIWWVYSLGVRIALYILLMMICQKYLLVICLYVLYSLPNEWTMIILGPELV